MIAERIDAILAVEFNDDGKCLVRGSVGTGTFGIVAEQAAKDESGTRCSSSANGPSDGSGSSGVRCLACNLVVDPNFPLLIIGLNDVRRSKQLGYLSGGHSFSNLTLNNSNGKVASLGGMELLTVIRCIDAAIQSSRDQQNTGK